MDTGDAKLNGVEGVKVEEVNGAIDLLPPPPVPVDVVVQLLTNHVKVNLTNIHGHICHYHVALFDEDGLLIDNKGIIRKVMDRVHDIYGAERKDFVYDGENSFFTFSALPRNKMEFPFVLRDTSSNRKKTYVRKVKWEPVHPHNSMYVPPCVYRSKTYKVEIKFAANIPLPGTAAEIHGLESRKSQEVLRVLNIILRQHAAKETAGAACLLFRQSYFRNDAKKFVDVGGGVLGCRGFHSSFHPTPCGLSLCIGIFHCYVSTTTIFEPGSVAQFLIDHHNVKNHLYFDWDKAEQVLKNLRIEMIITNIEYKITGLSPKICREEMFYVKQKSENDENCEPQMTEINVYDFYVNIRNIPLCYSGELPCINVGKPEQPKYIPMELCSLVPLQRYTEELTNLQKASLVEKSRQKPKERLWTLASALKRINYAEDPRKLVNDPPLRACGISVSNTFTQVEGRVLSAPQLKVGNGEDFFPRNGRWNFNNKKLLDPTKIEVWAIVNFSAHCNTSGFIKDFMKCGGMKGINIDWPFDVFECPQHKHAPPLVRVEKMFESITQSKLPVALQFLLCILPERKNSLLYGPWKRKSLSEYGIVTQCIAPIRVSDQYLTNIILKINAKLGGLNSKLSIEHSPAISIVSEAPTMILGMHISHGSTHVPSIAAVVSSRQWPLISKYRASVRTQSPKVKMIDSLFKKVSDSEDDGIMRELLMDFYESSGKRKPDQIIIFRNGVSESQFDQVLNVELNQIIEACKFLDGKWNPKFVVIIAQKNHHTKFFKLPLSADNVPAGTVIDDNRICHPRKYDNYDFYLCAQAGKIGATRRTHYHVLLDQVGFSTNDLQEFVHSPCYDSQRSTSTSAISVVAPIRYARLAATQVSQIIKFDDMSSGISGGGVTTAAAAVPVPVPQLPHLNEKLARSMFFV